MKCGFFRCDSLNVCDHVESVEISDWLGDNVKPQAHGDKD